MTARMWLLLSWVVVGAGILVVHAVLLWQVVRAKEQPVGERLWAILPVATPIVAWRAGRRAAPIVWATLVLTYLVLRFLEGSV